MKHKIGDIVSINKEWYQCVEGRCKDCYFAEKRYLCKQFITKNFCTSGIIFKKLEKVGEPFSCNYYGDSRLVMMQEYQLFDSNVMYCYQTPPMYITDYKHKRIAIEIKQNKEGMKEKKLNLKPFDIQKAREGKPVCTRDGRKARIICFDAEGGHPIIALVTDGVQEFPYNYTKEGYYHIEGVETIADLMMLPKKKEGWVNVYSNCLGGPYGSKERALKQKMKDCIDTVKISWEE